MNGICYLKKKEFEKSWIENIFNQKNDELIILENPIFLLISNDKKSCKLLYEIDIDESLGGKRDLFFESNEISIFVWEGMLSTKESLEHRNYENIIAYDFSLSFGLEYNTDMRIMIFLGPVIFKIKTKNGGEFTKKWFENNIKKIDENIIESFDENNIKKIDENNIVTKLLNKIFY
jgi:hypothetical protein